MWLKSAQDTMEDGHGRYVEPASSVKRSLAMYADEPGKAKVPDEFRSKDFGQGARWEVRWRVDGTAGASSSATGPRPRRSWPRSRSGYARTGTRIPWTPLRPLSEVADLWAAGAGGHGQGRDGGMVNAPARAARHEREARCPGRRCGGQKGRPCHTAQRPRPHACADCANPSTSPRPNSPTKPT